MSAFLLRVVGVLHENEQYRLFSVNIDSLRSGLDLDLDVPLSADDELGIEMVLR